MRASAVVGRTYPDSGCYDVECARVAVVSLQTAQRQTGHLQLVDWHPADVDALVRVLASVRHVTHGDEYDTSGGVFERRPTELT